MAVSVQYSQQERNLGMVMKEKDDDLALFLELRSRKEEKRDLLLQDSDDFDDQLGSKQDSSSISKITSTLSSRKTGADDFLSSENDKTDYDWLLTPPGTPLFPSLEMESKKTVMSQIGISNGCPAAPKSNMANAPAEPASRNNETSRQPVLSAGSNSSIVANRRSSLSGGLTSTASRPVAPTGRGTLPTTAKPSRPSTPTSRSTLPAIAKLSRPSTPTLRATLPSTKPAAPPVRSSTPTRSMARSLTPTSRSSVPAASKTTSRSATPTRRPSAPSSVTNTAGPAGRSSSVTKSGTRTWKNQVPSRGTSPTVKSRPWKPSEMPGFSNDALPNLKTSMPGRPASASRGRPGAPSVQSLSTQTSSKGRPRQQSCSPSSLRGRAPNGSAHNNGRSELAMSRALSAGSDDVSPVVIGTKMVERVVNMRKLAPPKQDDHISKNNNSSGKPLSSQENSGFGRTLSKKSLDMALRHMDTRRSIPGNLRPLVTNIPASSVYSVRSGSTKSRTVSVSDSPLATSSNTSSEPSVNNSSNCLDGSEVEYNDIGNERGHSSPASQPA